MEACVASFTGSLLLFRGADRAKSLGAGAVGAAGDAGSVDHVFRLGPVGVGGRASSDPLPRAIRPEISGNDGKGVQLGVLLGHDDRRENADGCERPRIPHRERLCTFVDMFVGSEYDLASRFAYRRGGGRTCRGIWL